VNGFLLDTQIVLWAADDPARLSAEVARAIREERSVFASAASIWEIAIKISIGKLTVGEKSDRETRKVWLQGTASHLGSRPAGCDAPEHPPRSL
jgi:PIN domain nuclease of toxin-antitoxin system